MHGDHDAYWAVWHGAPDIKWNSIAFLFNIGMFDKPDCFIQELN